MLRSLNSKGKREEGTNRKQKRITRKGSFFILKGEDLVEGSYGKGRFYFLWGSYAERTLRERGKKKGGHPKGKKRQGYIRKPYITKRTYHDWEKRGFRRKESGFRILFSIEGTKRASIAAGVQGGPRGRDWPIS